MERGSLSRSTPDELDLVSPQYVDALARCGLIGFLVAAVSAGHQTNLNAGFGNDGAVTHKPKQMFHVRCREGTSSLRQADKVARWPACRRHALTHERMSVVGHSTLQLPTKQYCQMSEVAQYQINTRQSQASNQIDERYQCSTFLATRMQANTVEEKE